MKYYVKVFRPEDNTILLEAVEKQKVSVPEEYYKFKNIWDALYVIDIERNLIKRVTDYYERKSLIHTGIRVIWVDDFIREVEADTKYERIWMKLYSEDGSVAYEGFTENGKPHGAGAAYYQNGAIYQTGIFGEKGLLLGQEYYDNGQLRFDGVYEYHCQYGPNYPLFGRCYYRDGRLMYSGNLKVGFVGNLSYPHIEMPEEYGPVALRERPKTLGGKCMPNTPDTIGLEKKDS